MEYYKDWMIVDTGNPEQPVGVYESNTTWLADDPAWTCESVEEAKRWVDAREVLDGISQPLGIEEAESLGMKTYSTEYKSTPTEELELSSKLVPLIHEERKAFQEYNLLSDTAYQIGRPDIAEKLKHIAEEEWKHHTVLSEIVRELSLS